MDHMLFGVSLKFTRAISTGTLLVIFKDSISTPKKKKKKNPTPSLVNDESFWLPRKLVNPYSKFGIHFTRKKKVRYSFYFVPRSDFLTPTSIYSVACFPLTTVNRCRGSRCWNETWEQNKIINKTKLDITIEKEFFHCKTLCLNK